MDSKEELLSLLHRLHQLLAARAYLNSALHSLRHAKLYLDSLRDSSLINEVRYVEEVVESLVGKVEGRIGSLVFGRHGIDKEFEGRVRRVIMEVVFRDGS